MNCLLLSPRSSLVSINGFANWRYQSVDVYGVHFTHRQRHQTFVRYLIWYSIFEESQRFPCSASRSFSLSRVIIWRAFVICDICACRVDREEEILKIRMISTPATPATHAPPSNPNHRKYHKHLLLSTHDDGLKMAKTTNLRKQQMNEWIMFASTTNTQKNKWTSFSAGHFWATWLPSQNSFRHHHHPHPHHHCHRHVMKVTDWMNE